MTSFEAKARAIILKDNKVFLSKWVKSQTYYLPGWTHEIGESLTDSLYREIYEEFGVKAEIDKLIAVRELFIWERNILDFWFLVKNIDDFLNIDKSKCSHWFEWDDARFFSEEELENISVLPKDIFEIIRKSKENVLVELV